MDWTKDTTEHVKYKHLTYEERLKIELRIKDGWTVYRIAKDELHCAANTVKNEIKCGNILYYNGMVARYKAQAGQKAYKANRQNSRKPYQSLEKTEFLNYATQHFREDKCSLDSCAGRSLQSGKFSRTEVVCTKYNYVDVGLMPIKNIDLPEKLKRKSSNKRSCEHKKMFGRSIEERPADIEKREEFGHWEADLVIGSKKGDDAVLLVMVERKGRNYQVLRVKDKTAELVMQAFAQLRSCYGTAFGLIFKTITTDNGSEFSRLSELELAVQTLVFSHTPTYLGEKVR